MRGGGQEGEGGGGVRDGGGGEAWKEWALSCPDLGLRWRGGHQESLQGPGARRKRGSLGSSRVCAGAEGAWSGARAGQARRKGGGGEGLRRGRGRAELLEGPPPPPPRTRARPLPRLPRHAPSHPSPPPPGPRPQSLVCSPAASQPAHRSSASAAAAPSSTLISSSSSAVGVPSVSRAPHWAPPDGPSPRAVPSSRWPSLLQQFTCCPCRPLWPRIRPEIPGSIGTTPLAPLALWAPTPRAGAAQPLPSPSGGLCSRGSASLPLTLGGQECSVLLRFYSFWLWLWSPGFPGWGL